MQSGGQSSSESYQGALSFNGLAGSGAASTTQGQGVTPFVRGFDGAIGHQYSGPYSETLITYTYPTNHVQPHAVSSRSNGDSFTYDANGNMTQRTQNNVTWTQTFDAENRLVSVAGGGTTTQYIYDGSGSRVKRIVNDGSSTVTTIYVAGMEIELHGSTEDHRTIYYAAGGTFRVVGGANPGLYFRHGDHLGSTSVLSDSSGNKVANSDVVFAPYGEVRTGELSTLTDFGFTGQRVDRDSGGLMYYGARYYLPGLNRFISADTIVPGAGNPQNLNRFAYAGNNPVRYVDPTGHMYEDEGDGRGGCMYNCDNRGGGDDGRCVGNCGGDGGGGGGGGDDVARCLAHPRQCGGGNSRRGGGPHGNDDTDVIDVRDPTSLMDSGEDCNALESEINTSCKEDPNPPVEALVAIAIPMIVGGAIAEVGLVWAEVVITEAGVPGSAACGPFAPVCLGGVLAADAILTAIELAIIDYEVSFVVYTYRVAQAQGQYEVRQDLNPLTVWGLSESENDKR